MRMLPGDTLTWYSDKSTSADGWKVCADHGSWQGLEPGKDNNIGPFFFVVVGFLGPILGCMLLNFMMSANRGSGPPRPTAAQRRYYHSMCPLWDCIVDMVREVWQCGRSKCRRCCASAVRAEDGTL